MTDYIVFKYNDASEAWSEIDQTPAASSEAAIRKVLAEPPSEGVYVAVPARSWKPLRVAAQVKTQLKLSEA